MLTDAWGRPLLCGLCGAALPRRRGPGRPRRWCSKACWQKAHALARRLQRHINAHAKEWAQASR